MNQTISRTVDQLHQNSTPFDLLKEKESRKRKAILEIRKALASSDFYSV